MKNHKHGLAINRVYSFQLLQLDNWAIIDKGLSLLSRLYLCHYLTWSKSWLKYIYINLYIQVKFSHDGHNMTGMREITLV